jgi:GDPmannose 4,6-dehydratase
MQRQPDISMAREKLGWEPKIKFDDLVKIMIDHDLELAKKESLILSMKHMKQ